MQIHMIMKLVILGLVAAVAFATPVIKRHNEVWTKEQTEAAGLVHRGNFTISPLPHEYIDTKDLPTNFTWCDRDGVNYCTKSLNQHIPQVNQPPEPCPPPRLIVPDHGPPDTVGSGKASNAAALDAGSKQSRRTQGCFAVVNCEP